MQLQQTAKRVEVDVGQSQRRHLEHEETRGDTDSQVTGRSRRPRNILLQGRVPENGPHAHHGAEHPEAGPHERQVPEHLLFEPEAAVQRAGQSADEVSEKEEGC